MAAFDTSSAPTGNDRAVGRFTSFLRSVSTALIQWNEDRITRKALSQLTIYELDDIGLTPSDVARLGRR